jgi:hypothetical protein
MMMIATTALPNVRDYSRQMKKHPYWVCRLGSQLVGPLPSSPISMATTTETTKVSSSLAATFQFNLVLAQQRGRVGVLIST